MSKVVDQGGRLWYEEVTPGNYHIGLTEDILSRVKNECWSIIPNVGNIKQGQPLFAIETNDELLSILSPFTGRVLDVEFAAQNSPEKLTPSTRIVSFGVGAKPKPRMERAQISPELLARIREARPADAPVPPAARPFAERGPFDAPPPALNAEQLAWNAEQQRRVLREMAQMAEQERVQRVVAGDQVWIDDVLQEDEEA